MIPILKAKKSQSIPQVFVTTRKPDGGQETPELAGDHALQAAAEDILRAITSKDAGHLALALRSAFTILESEDHEEGPSEESDSE